MPSGKKRKRHKMATHKRKKRLRKNRHKKKQDFPILYWPKINTRLIECLFLDSIVFCPCVIRHLFALKSVAFGKGINNRFNSYWSNHSFN